MKERWRPVLGGYYEVSSEGNLRRSKPGTSTYVGKPVKPVRLPNGYWQFRPCINAKSACVYVHRLVAEAFLGPVPPGKEVNHVDGDKGNNRAKNLEYVTRAENMAHARANGLYKPLEKLPPRLGPFCKGLRTGERHWMRHKPERIARGERAGSSVLTESIVVEVRRRHEAGEKQRDLARAFGISPAQVCRIVNRKHWRHLG